MVLVTAGKETASSAQQQALLVEMQSLTYLSRLKVTDIKFSQPFSEHRC